MSFTPLYDLNGYIWLDGKFVEWKNCNIHIMTHSLHYADSVFEGIRVYNSKIFKLNEHIDRLFYSADVLKLKINFSKEEIKQACIQSVAKNNLNLAYIRPLVWRGAETINIYNPILSTHAMIAAYESPKRKEQEMHLCISKFVKIHADAVPVGCKCSGNYTNLVPSLHDALEKGFEDAIMLDFRGYIAECTTSNIFFVDKNQKVITPLADNCLNGITRQTIISLANDLKFEVIEKHISLDDLNNFEECFITGTSVEVKKIKSITLPQGQKYIFAKHNVTNILKNEYLKLVGEK